MLPARKDEVFSMEGNAEKTEGRLGSIAADLGAVRQQLGRIEGLHVSVAVLTDQSARTMADVSELKRDTKELRKEISNAKIWALLIAAAILGVLARGFHWI